MRIGGYLGAMCFAAVSMGAAAAAEGEVGVPADPRAPTVTIINKSPDVPKTPDVPELAVTPARPAAVQAPLAPAAPARVAVPAAPARPSAPSTPLPAEQAKAPEAPAAPAEAAAATDAAPAEEPQPQLPPTLAIDIDLSAQRMTVSEHGEVRHTWPISSARYGYRTPTGTFSPTWMTKMWYSRQYDYAPMPHAIFFHKGVAIHATYAVGMLGRPASHGCVRLAPKNAAQLFKLVTSHTKARTEIVVHGTPVHTSPRVAEYSEDGTVQLRRGSRYRYQPGYAQRAPAPSYYYSGRTRQYNAMPRRQPRGFYAYGF